jgi:tRNA U34 5-methylaminomethyl-2-thiouridine-forming methyltransferase MnmC
MKRELKITSDGSHTLYVPEIDEHYHSIHGAIQESMHVFIDKGIDALFCKKVDVLEVGFGTGLNALLTALWSSKHNLPVNYVGIEAFPLATEVNSSLNYGEKLEVKEAEDFFTKIILAKWNDTVNIHSVFTLSKIERYIQEFETEQKFDIVYFDAFGPNSQKEIWELPILKKMYDCLKQNGVFVTYSAKGELKRNLSHIGFDVESLPGPPGKREMTRARKF